MLSPVSSLYSKINLPTYLSNAEIDVSLAHPYNKELISTSAKVNGHAASVREKEKIEKYARFQHPGGRDSLLK